jgi:hypothetical protein
VGVIGLACCELLQGDKAIRLEIAGTIYFGLASFANLLANLVFRVKIFDDEWLKEVGNVRLQWLPRCLHSETADMGCETGGGFWHTSTGNRSEAHNGI